MSRPRHRQLRVDSSKFFITLYRCLWRQSSSMKQRDSLRLLRITTKRSDKIISFSRSNGCQSLVLLKTPFQSKIETKNSKKWSRVVSSPPTIMQSMNTAHCSRLLLVATKCWAEPNKVLTHPDISITMSRVSERRQWAIDSMGVYYPVHNAAQHGSSSILLHTSLSLAAQCAVIGPVCGGRAL